MLSRAISIVAQAFEGRVDKGGHPYFLHCMRVMNAVKHLGEDVMCIAIMHDLVEDCEEWTIERLVHEKFNQRVIYGVICMTHKKEDSYDAYIKNIALNEDARQVKMADLRDNSDITRIKGLTKKDLDRVEKYHRAYEYLKKV